MKRKDHARHPGLQRRHSTAPAFSFRRAMTWRLCLVAVLGLSAAAVLAAWMLQPSSRLVTRAVRAAPPAGQAGSSRTAAPATDTEKDRAAETNAHGDAEALKDEQLREARQLAQSYPQSDDAVYLEGLILYQRGDLGGALDRWNRCLTLNPRRPDLYDFSGRVLVWTGQPEKALAMFRKALELQPRLLPTRVQLAQVLLEQGKLQDAVQTLREDPRPHPQASLLLGQVYQQLGEHQQAKDMFLLAVQLSPESAEACYGLARTCARLNERELSAEYHDKFQKLKARQQTPDRDAPPVQDALQTTGRRVAQTHTEAGRIYRGLRDVRQAERLWRRAAAIDPSGTQCRSQLAQLLQAQGRLVDALRLYEELTRLEPKRGIHFFHVGNVNLQLKSYAAAEIAYEKVIDLEPERADGYQALAQCYVIANRHVDRAPELARRAVQLNPAAPVYAVLSLACARAGERAAAKQAIQQALALDPGNAEYRRRLLSLDQQR